MFYKMEKEKRVVGLERNKRMKGEKNQREREGKVWVIVRGALKRSFFLRRRAEGGREGLFI